MSLGRTALRLAAIEALAPTASIANDGPWPTIARHRVYDAMIDTIDDLVLGNRAPTIAVYTEESEAQSFANGPPFRATVDLCFEVSITQMAEDPDAPGTFFPAAPVTDPESEASIDLLEASIRFALIYGPTGAIFRTISGNRIKSISSTPSRTGEEAIRLAMRSIKMTIEITDDCYDLAPTAPLTGLDALPQPLRGLADLLPAGSYGAAVIAGLATSAPTAPVPSRPWGIDGAVDAHQPHDPDADPDVSIVIDPPQI